MLNIVCSRPRPHRYCMSGCHNYHMNPGKTFLCFVHIHGDIVLLDSLVPGNKMYRLLIRKHSCICRLDSVRKFQQGHLSTHFDTDPRDTQNTYYTIQFQKHPHFCLRNLDDTDLPGKQDILCKSLVL